MVKVVKGLPAEWGKCSRTIVLDICIETLSYHNNSIAVWSQSGDIIILDTITGAQTAVLSGHTDLVGCAVFSSDGTSLVSGSHDKTVKLWDVQTGGVVKTFSGYTHWVNSVSISANHTTIASGSDDFTICLWDIKTGECHHTIKQEGSVKHVTFSPTDPQHLISISCDQVWQWDANGHRTKVPFGGHHVSFSSDGAQFVSGYHETITIHNSGSGATIAMFWIASGYFPQCSFSPDSRLVAVATQRTAYCWDVTSSRPQHIETFVGHTDRINSLVFSSPTTLLSASGDKSIKFWQIGAQSTDPVVNHLESTPLPSAQIRSITLQTKDGIFITSDSDGMVKTWDISTGIHKASVQTPAKDYTRDVRQIDDRLILVYHASGSIYVWDAGNGKKLLKVKGFYSTEDLRISGDGSKIFQLHAPSMRAWTIQHGKPAGDVRIGYSGSAGSLVVDGSKVWAHWPQSEYQGWRFGTILLTHAKLSGMPTLSNGRMLWDPRQGRIKNAVTGGIIFQLSGRFASPADVQCDGSYLVAGYESGEILILELKDVVL